MKTLPVPLINQGRLSIINKIVIEYTSSIAATVIVYYLDRYGKLDSLSSFALSNYSTESHKSVILEPKLKNISAIWFGISDNAYIYNTQLIQELGISV